MKIKTKKKIYRLRPQIKLALVLIAVFMLLIITGIKRGKKISFWRQAGLDARSKQNLTINAVPVGSCTAEFDGIAYIQLDTIKEHIDPDVYYNQDEGRVIITTYDEVYRLDSDASTKNSESIELNFSVYNDSGKVYLPLEIVERIYGCKSMRFEETGITALYTADTWAKTAKKTKLYSAAEKGRHFGRVEKDTQILIYEETDDFFLAQIAENGDMGGFVGYIPKSAFADYDKAYNYGSANTAHEAAENEVWQPDGRINLVFDQISNAAGASVTMSSGAPTGVNVLCPTWFSFKDTGGEVINKANADYVEWAHDNDIHVWGLVTDNFETSVSHAVLSDDKTREYAIKQLIAYADMYSLDGINIDFEAVPKDDSAAWIQFLRELAPLCHEHGLTLSCDLFVPKMWSMYYNRQAVGEIVDYTVVMGYDEHYRGSDSAGSVASMDWSLSAVKDTLNAGVPKEKLILGVPFYTRIWTECTNGELESSAYGMDEAYKLLEMNNADFVFDEKTGQNYAEYTDGEGRHRCWLEDEQSVQKRAALVREYDIAGIGAWKLRMEKDGIFEIIDEEIGK